jgi:hypothetical protein
MESASSASHFSKGTGSLRRDDLCVCRCGMRKLRRLDCFWTVACIPPRHANRACLAKGSMNELLTAKEREPSRGACPKISASFNDAHRNDHAETGECTLFAGRTTSTRLRSMTAATRMCFFPNQRMMNMCALHGGHRYSTIAYPCWSPPLFNDYRRLAQRRIRPLPLNKQRGDERTEHDPE